jgi:hypothetical protein
MQFSECSLSGFRLHDPALYTGQALDDVDPSELLELPADIAERISEALVLFGYKPEPDYPALVGIAAAGDNDSACGVLNNQALANLDAWVPQLNLYRCQRTAMGYKAVATWRASNSGQADERRKLNLHVTHKGSGPYNWLTVV